MFIERVDALTSSRRGVSYPVRIQRHATVVVDLVLLVRGRSIGATVCYDKYVRPHRRLIVVHDLCLDTPVLGSGELCLVAGLLGIYRAH